MVEYLKHIGTVGKILWGLVVLIVTSTASVFMYISAGHGSLRAEMLSLRDQDMAMISSRLTDIATDARDTKQDVRDIKRHLMDRRN